jgi:putative transposase
MASQGLPPPLALAITLSGTTQDRHRNPCFDPPYEQRDNPLGGPRIHGELLKLGIKISQATVGRWMPWRPKVPSPTWRSFLRNHLSDVAAIDKFVIATATFQLLYTLIVLSHNRRRGVHFEVTPNPTQVWLSG